MPPELNRGDSGLASRPSRSSTTCNDTDDGTESGTGYRNEYADLSYGPPSLLDPSSDVNFRIRVGHGQRSSSSIMCKYVVYKCFSKSHKKKIMCPMSTHVSVHLSAQMCTHVHVIRTRRHACTFASTHACLHNRAYSDVSTRMST